MSRRRGTWHGRPLVIGEELFRDVLVRERKRADRFGEPFALLVVSARDGYTVEASMWASVIEVLTTAKRDTDVLGWLERNSAVALVIPEIESLDSAFTQEVDSRLSAGLASRLDAEVRSAFSVRVHRYSGLAPSQSVPDESPLPGLRRSARARVEGGLKRLLDVIASGLLLVVAAPIFLLVALLVKATSRGPVFFRQPRVGEHGKCFTMLKFRTMKVNADSAIHKEFVSQMIQGTAPAGTDPDQAAPFKIVNDPRVTPVGRFLRRTSLDELPQLWNVLRGDMSLVGPRPPLAYEVEQYKPWHYRRLLEAKPGITGLWQVSGRSQTTFDDMVRLDLRYAKKCSTWTDVKILLATPRAVISGKGAR
jgi:exopolysaccharide biosynthesis polyprenyl glycosylphosphotransferase